ncbi:hypothetical protein RP20_CCG005335 [Aedes albopictus]|nr:hypothetical protein RP20_CCG005335 [Aedes albopictus]
MCTKPTKTMTTTFVAFVAVPIFSSRNSCRLLFNSSASSSRYFQPTMLIEPTTETDNKVDVFLLHKLTTGSTTWRAPYKTPHIAPGTSSFNNGGRLFTVLRLITLLRLYD